MRIYVNPRIAGYTTATERYIKMYEQESGIRYPVVGDVLYIKKPIGNYRAGDFFFVHAQDNSVVSDCAIVGLHAINAGFDETFIYDTDILNGVAEVVRDYKTTTAEELWTIHCINRDIDVKL